jgi:hypothetical protein
LSSVVLNTRKQHPAARPGVVCGTAARLLVARGADDPAVRRAQMWLSGLRPAPSTASVAN